MLSATDRDRPLTRERTARCIRRRWTSSEKARPAPSHCWPRRRACRRWAADGIAVTALHPGRAPDTSLPRWPRSRRPNRRSYPRLLSTARRPRPCSPPCLRPKVSPAVTSMTTPAPRPRCRAFAEPWHRTRSTRRPPSTNLDRHTTRRRRCHVDARTSTTGDRRNRPLAQPGRSCGNCFCVGPDRLRAWSKAIVQYATRGAPDGRLCFLAAMPEQIFGLRALDRSSHNGLAPVASLPRRPAGPAASESGTD